MLHHLCLLKYCLLKFWIGLVSPLRHVCLAMIAGSLLNACHVAAAEIPVWPQFRGPNASGVAPDDAELPTEIGPDKHVVWKVPIPSGISSPVVWGDAIYLTALEDKKLWTLAISATDGQTLWRQEAPYDRLEKVHKVGSPATASVVTDGEHVVSMFGSSGLYCYDRGGKLLWQVALGPFDNQFGAPSSPILVDGLVVLVEDHDNDSYLAAFDIRTGENRWRTDRSFYRRNYNSPVTWRQPDETQVVVAGTAQVTGYDAKSGALRWFIRDGSRVVSSTPVVGSDNRLYVANSGGGEEAALPSFAALAKGADANNNGELEAAELPNSLIKRFIGQFDRNKSGGLDAPEYESIREILSYARSVAMAIRPGAEGDATKTHQAWTYTRSLPRNSTPVVYDGTLFFVNDGGILTALDAETGEAQKQGRLRGTDAYFSSPVVGDGKLFTISQRGRLTVVSAEPNWKILADANFGEDVMATPAVVGGKIYLRTAGHLYCFSKSSP